MIQTDADGSQGSGGEIAEGGLLGDCSIIQLRKRMLLEENKSSFLSPCSLVKGQEATHAPPTQHREASHQAPPLLESAP